jgi:hypothetical protein
MASLLHPEHWRELAPEFEARKLLLAAEAVLTEAGVVDTAPVAKTIKGIREALRMQHPCTQDPAALAEFEARLAGTYEPAGGSTGERRGQRADPRDKLIADLQARLGKLEDAADAEPAKPAKPAKDQPAATKPADK